MPVVHLDLVDGRRLDINPNGPFTVREQLEWEKQFGRSFVTVARAQRLDAQLAAEDPDAPAYNYQVRWMLFFAWWRLRAGDHKELPARFDEFVDQVEDWTFEPDPEPADSEAPAQAGPEDGSVDPTDPAPSGGSPPPAVSTPEPAPAL